MSPFDFYFLPEKFNQMIVNWNQKPILAFKEQIQTLVTNCKKAKKLTSSIENHVTQDSESILKNFKKYESPFSTSSSRSFMRVAYQYWTLHQRTKPAYHLQ